MDEMAEKIDSSDESEQYGGDDYGDQAGGRSMPWYGDYHNWPAYSAGYSQPYCDTMYHTRFYHQKNPMDVQVSLNCRFQYQN